MSNTFSQFFLNFVCEFLSKCTYSSLFDSSSTRTCSYSCFLFFNDKGHLMMRWLEKGNCGNCSRLKQRLLTHVIVGGTGRPADRHYLKTTARLSSSAASAAGGGSGYAAAPGYPTKQNVRKFPSSSTTTTTTSSSSSSTLSGQSNKKQRTDPQTYP